MFPKMIGDFYSKKALPNPPNKDNPRQTESFAPNLRGRGGPPMPVPPPAPPPPKINNDSTGSDVLAPGSNPLDRIYKANKQKEMEKQGKAQNDSYPQNPPQHSDRLAQGQNLPPVSQIERNIPGRSSEKLFYTFTLS